MYKELKNDDRYRLFVEIFSSDVNSDNNELFKVYLEDRLNFDISCLLSLKDEFKFIDESPVDGDDEINAKRIAIQQAIRSSQVYPSESKSSTYINLIRGNSGMNKIMSMMGASMMSLGVNPFKTYELSKNRYVPTPHWK